MLSEIYPLIQHSICGRPASAVADGHELAVQSFISLILQIEGQRYKAPPFVHVAALALAASPQSPNPLACASQVLRPDQRSAMLHHARCVAAEQSSPSYLVLGMSKTSAQHPGSSRTSAG